MRLKHSRNSENGAAGCRPARATARGYAREVAAYTHGLGRWAVLPAGYDACHNTDEVLAPRAMTPMPTPTTRRIQCSAPRGRVPCKMGRGPRPAHVSSGLERRLGAAPAAGQTQEEDGQARRRRPPPYRGTLEQDKELLAILSAPTVK